MWELGRKLLLSRPSAGFKMKAFSGPSAQHAWEWGGDGDGKGFTQALLPWRPTDSPIPPPPQEG